MSVLGDFKKKKNHIISEIYPIVWILLPKYTPIILCRSAFNLKLRDYDIGHDLHTTMVLVGYILKNYTK